MTAYDPWIARCTQCGELRAHHGGVFPNYSEAQQRAELHERATHRDVETHTVTIERQH